MKYPGIIETMDALGFVTQLQNGTIINNMILMGITNKKTLTERHGGVVGVR